MLDHISLRCILNALHLGSVLIRITLAGATPP